MVDKFRKTHPMSITFADGEQPTSDKLNTIAQQSRNGSDLLERAIGDPWNQSADSLLFSQHLQLPNLARMLGQNSYLNPAIYPLESDFQFTEDIGNRWTGKVDGYLLFKPKTSSTFTGSGSHFTNEVSSEYLVGRNLTNEYWVDNSTGRFRVDSELQAGDTVTYTVAPSDDWLVGSETFPGVIPDVRQDDFTSCRLEYTGGKYYLHLPPRQPLNFSHGSFDRPEAEPTQYPNATEQVDSDNLATDTSSPYKYWQNPANDAIALQFYRYSLPKEFRDVYSSMAGGDEYSPGVLFLWDKDSGTIIENTVFKKPSGGGYSSSPWVLEISNSTTDLSGYISSPDDETETAYNSTNLALITTGTPVARALWNTITSFLRHTHNNDETFVPAMNHSNLTNLDPPIASGNTHAGRYPSYLPRWTKSAFENDDHTQYLSRTGSSTTVSGYRDLYNNAMLGPMIMANADESGADNFLDNLANGSFPIYFGGIGGPYLMANTSRGIAIASDDGLVVTVSGSDKDAITATGSGTGVGVYGISADGAGLYGTSTNSPGLYAISVNDIAVSGVSTNQAGVTGLSTNAVGVCGIGGSTAQGILGFGGSSGGTGVQGFGGSTNGTGIEGIGGSSNGVGGIFIGSGFGDGIQVTGGAEIDHINNLNVTGSVQSSLIPANDGGPALGSSSKAWNYLKIKKDDAGNAIVVDVSGGDDPIGINIISTSDGGGISSVGIYSEVSGGPINYGVYGYTSGAVNNNYGLYGYATGATINYGVYGISPDGHGVVAEGDTSNPSKAAFRVVPQGGSAPSSAALGDIYVDSDDNRLYFHNGSSWDSVLAPTSRVIALRTSALAITSGGTYTIVFNSESLDTKGEYNPSTGVFTASEAGIYVVHWSVKSLSESWTAGQNVYTGVFKNTAQYTNIKWEAHATRSIAETIGQGSAIVELSASNTLEIKLSHNLGSDLNLDVTTGSTYFHIHRLS